MTPKTRAEAEALGFIVDDCCAWVAYKGSRFAPTEHYVILTDLEAELLAACRAAFLHIGRTGGNVADGPGRDEWYALRAAIAKAEGGAA